MDNGCTLALLFLLLADSIADAANVFPAGQAGTSALGTIAVVAEANVTLTGIHLLQLLEL
jgi:hypothetical protein